LPERGLPMSIAAATFRGASEMPIVVITTGVRGTATNRSRVNGANPGAPQFEPIEILTSATRDVGKTVTWHRQRLSIAIPDGAGDLLYETVSGFALEPGTYEVRVASRHERTQVAGSVHTYVDVPDFEHQPLALSGLVLFDRQAPIATPPEALKGVLDTAPTTRRDFTPADDVSALVRVYQRRRQSPIPVTVVFRVLDGTREVASSENLLGSDQFASDREPDARYRVPLTTLKPGAYVLRVEASASGTTLHRELPFTVR